MTTYNWMLARDSIDYRFSCVTSAWLICACPIAATPLYSPLLSFLHAALLLLLKNLFAAASLSPERTSLRQ